MKRVIRRKLLPLVLTLVMVISMLPITAATAAPTATVSMDDTHLKVGETSIVTITFSEVVIGFTNADLLVPNGVLSIVSSSDGGITWTATFTPAPNIEDATNFITLDNSGVQDLAGNSGVGTTDSNNYVIDTRRPTATVSMDDTALKVGETSIVTITFSEAVTGFTNADLVIANGVLSNVSSSDGGITWTATFTPAHDVEESSNLITLDNSGVQDLAGNTGVGTTDSNNYTIDTRRPTATVSMDDTALTAGQTYVVTFTFSEVVTGYTNDDISVDNGTLTPVSSADGGVTYTATFTAASVNDGTNSIVVDLTGITDVAGNAGIGTASSANYAITIPTAPDAPTIGTATAGNGQAIVSFTPPASNGGSAITSYTVTASPGGATATGNATPIMVTGLTNGTAYTFTVTATNSVGTGAVSAESNNVTPQVPSTGSDDSDWSPPTVVEEVANNASGIETTEEINGQTEVTLVVDSQKVSDQMAAALRDPAGNREITLEVTNTGDVTKVSIGANLLKNLQDNGFTITVKEETIAYSLDTTSINIETIAEQMGIPADSLQNIEIEISINKLPSEQAQAFAQQAQANGHVLLFMPVQFEITARTTLADGSTQEIKITKFTSFAERVLEMPEETDPDDIGTAVVFNPNGTYSHVPTVVFQKEGKTHVGIKSLTNSIYSVIANQVSLASVKGHWSETHVNDMAKRLILVDYENFVADQTITRAEFADYIVRAFGLHREGLTITNKFTDISTNKHRTSILIANDWGIIQGYPDHTFKPDATITRQEAMTMYARAMDLANIVENKADQLTSFHDGKEVSAWATAYVRRVVNAEIFTGKGNGILDPKGTLTHAESLTAIRNLLLKAELINN